MYTRCAEREQGPACGDPGVLGYSLMTCAGGPVQSRRPPLGRGHTDVIRAGGPGGGGGGGVNAPGAAATTSVNAAFRWA